jgi:hypothetical protein
MFPPCLHLSHGLLLLSLYPSPFPLDHLTLSKTRQEIRHTKNMSARKTAHVQITPHPSILTFPLLPLVLLTPILFRLYLTNPSLPILPIRFSSLAPLASSFPISTPPPAPVNLPSPSSAPPQALPFKALSSVTNPPLIADTGCTGLLLQMSNFASLRPFFSHKSPHLTLHSS